MNVDDFPKCISKAIIKEVDVFIRANRDKAKD